MICALGKASSTTVALASTCRPVLTFPIFRRDQNTRLMLWKKTAVCNLHSCMQICLHTLRANKTSVKGRLVIASTSIVAGAQGRQGV